MTTDLIILALMFSANTYIVASWLMWLFDTTLLIHIFELLRYAGYRKSDTDYWSRVEYVGDKPLKYDLASFTREDLDEWMSTHLNKFWRGVLSCPGCLSMHISFWTALSSSILIYGFAVLNNPVLLFLFAWCSWWGVPSLALNNLKHVH